MFIDVARISLRAGKGGDGVVAFHREKYIAAGGPDGGDGGRGGDVCFEIDEHMSTLMDFRYKRKYSAGDGNPGAGKNCTGKDGETVIIKVPRGTLLKDPESGGVIKDMSQPGERFVIAKGGRGGWGNQHFATPTRQAPRFAKSGLPGQSRDVVLELKLLADVGLVGFPNVGKSTFLSVVSAARPKIANYHFTTLAPNLGVVRIDEGRSFVLADIPGLIEGAHEGAGLGFDFLRHIDRCRMIIHIVDVSGCEGRDPIEDFEAINRELGSYSPELSKKPQIVAGNKRDLTPDGDLSEKLREHAAQKGFYYFEMSAATRAGVDSVIGKTAEMLSKLPPVRVFETDYIEPEARLDGPEDLDISVVDGVFVVSGGWLERLMANTNFSDHESRMFFERTLRRSGVFERLEAEGIEEGGAVRLYNVEFQYVK